MLTVAKLSLSVDQGNRRRRGAAGAGGPVSESAISSTEDALKERGAMERGGG